MKIYTYIATVVSKVPSSRLATEHAGVLAIQVGHREDCSGLLMVTKLIWKSIEAIDKSLNQT